MEPRDPKPQKPKADAEPPLEIEGGELDKAPTAPPPEPPGGMIGEGGGASGEDGRDGGMIGEG